FNATGRFHDDKIILADWKFAWIKIIYFTGFFKPDTYNIIHKKVPPANLAQAVPSKDEDSYLHLISVWLPKLHSFVQTAFLKRFATHPLQIFPEGRDRQAVLLSLIEYKVNLYI